MTERVDNDLRNLARLHGVSPSYVDAAKERHDAHPNALLCVLRALDVPIERAADAGGMLVKRRQELWRRVVEPVVVIWQGAAQGVPLRLPADQTPDAVRCRIAYEGGGEHEWVCAFEDLTVRRRRQFGGESYVACLLVLPRDVPLGYHDVTIEIDDESHRTRLIVAPSHVHTGPPAEHPRWGVFAPLYALHDERCWGAGDFSTLRRLMDWTSDRGGNLVATLPLLPSLWELSDDPSPYSPTSRLFWNEFYLDVTRVPEFKSCEDAQRLLRSDEAQHTLDELRGARYVDYHRHMALKRQVLMTLADFFFARSSKRRSDLDRFRDEHPDVDRFVRFRAVGEKQGAHWPEWPRRLRGGRIEDHDFDERVYRYHLYTQWQVQQQLQGLTDHAKASDLLWYLDLPLGTNGGGFDVWSRPECFATGMSGGAPPDSFFPGGQSWGFPPLHPRRIRDDGHAYLIACLRHHLRCAKVLRIDHVMSLQRLYWVPEGMKPTDGVYVRYPREELFAVLSLESHRHGALIVGENLGTVPPSVDHAMQRHRLPGMYVLPFEVEMDEPEKPLRPVDDGDVASLNTHDLPQFAAFWNGLDIDDRADLNLMTDEQIERERARRCEFRRVILAYLRREDRIPDEAVDPVVVMEAMLKLLASSRAGLVLVNLEDLWEETEPQNTPGTHKERPNWRRKMRYGFEQFADLPAVRRIVGAVDAERRAADVGA